MHRRNFIETAALGLGGLSLPTPLVAEVLGMPATSAVKDTFHLGSRYASASIEGAYTATKGSPPTPSPGPQPPHVLLFFDPKANTFKSPIDLKPALEKGEYELTTKLEAFNISRQQYDTFHTSRSDLQLGLNVSASPVAGQDPLWWLFMSAINVFTQKPADVAAQLSKLKALAPTDSLPGSNKIVIGDGRLDLQISAFGQRKEGFWAKLFGAAKQVVDSPLFASFAIPSLVRQSVDFIGASLNIINGSDSLVKVWETHALTFGIHKGVTETFVLNPGYWVTVDRAFALDHDYLASGFSLDLKGESFQIIYGDKRQPVDANYLVTWMDLRPHSSK